MTCIGGACWTAAAQMFVSSAVLLWAFGSAQNGPTGPFEPPYKVEYNLCTNHTTYCAPKLGEYPEPVRPPVWLKPYLKEPARYTGLHNDLAKLLEVRHRERWVTVFQYTLGQRDFFLNALYTYLKFGEADFFIVATVTYGAFEDCVAMQLPCYNATHHYAYIAKHMGDEGYHAHKEDSHHSHHNFGTVLHVQLTWMNVHLGLAILRHGYNFQHSDLDVGFMRKIMPSLGLLERLGADLAMLPLARNKSLNPANVFALSNARSIAFYHAYLGLLGNHWDNELAVNKPQLNTSFERCSTKEACTNITASGKAALVELPTLFAHSSCYSSTLHDGPCSSRLLFLHVLCRSGRPWKAWSMKNSGLWFLTDFSGNEVNASAGLGQTLPCASPDDVAWHKNLSEY